MTKPLRVLFLMEDLCFGGTQRQTLELARRLDRSRFTPVMLTLTGPTDLDKAAHEAGIDRPGDHRYGDQCTCMYPIAWHWHWRWRRCAQAVRDLELRVAALTTRNVDDGSQLVAQLQHRRDRRLECCTGAVRWSPRRWSFGGSFQEYQILCCAAVNRSDRVAGVERVDDTRVAAVKQVEQVECELEAAPIRC